MQPLCNGCTQATFWPFRSVFSPPCFFMRPDTSPEKSLGLIGFFAYAVCNRCATGVQRSCFFNVSESRCDAQKSLINIVFFGIEKVGKSCATRALFFQKNTKKEAGDLACYTCEVSRFGPFGGDHPAVFNRRRFPEPMPIPAKYSSAIAMFSRWKLSNASQ